MTVEEILAFREKSLEKEMDMWVELLNDKYPIGKVVELDGEKLKVVGYCYVQSIPAVKFEKVVTNQISKLYFNLPGFEKGGAS